MLPLWHEGGVVVILSVLALSLRFSLITASMAPLLVNVPRGLRAALASACSCMVPSLAAGLGMVVLVAVLHSGAS